MEATILPLVKPHLLEEFKQNWHKWFVLEDTVLDEKTPGKMKSKFFSIIISLDIYR